MKAIKLGAFDFLEKPFSIEGLRARIAQLHQIKFVIIQSSSYCFDQIDNYLFSLVIIYLTAHFYSLYMHSVMV